VACRPWFSGNNDYSRQALVLFSLITRPRKSMFIWQKKLIYKALVIWLHKRNKRFLSLPLEVLSTPEASGQGYGGVSAASPSSKWAELYFGPNATYHNPLPLSETPFCGLPSPLISATHKELSWFQFWTPPVKVRVSKWRTYREYTISIFINYVFIVSGLNVRSK